MFEEAAIDYEYDFKQYCLEESLIPVIPGRIPENKFYGKNIDLLGYL